MLEDERLKGNLIGLHISEHKSLLCQLFADDAGVFLLNSQMEIENARATIQTYEDISGAFLNVAKSVIVPLVNSAQQDWLNGIGYKVLQ